MRYALLACWLFSLTLFGCSNAFAQQAPLKDAPASAIETRAQQVIALSTSKEPDAGAKLREALADESWYIRGEAARALGRLGDRSLQALVLPLIQDENWFVRFSALEAMAALKASTEATPLRDSLTSPDEYVRARGAATSAAAGASANDSLITALAIRNPSCDALPRVLSED